MLPKGATETGDWSLTGGGNGEIYVPISFPIQLGIAARAKAGALRARRRGRRMHRHRGRTDGPGRNAVRVRSRSQEAGFAGIFDSSGIEGGAGKSGAFIVFEPEPHGAPSARGRSPADHGRAGGA